MLRDRSILVQSVQLAQVDLVLVLVKALEDGVAELLPIQNTSSLLKCVQPGSRCTGEVEGGEPRLQVGIHGVHLEIHVTVVTPQSGVLTIKLWELDL